MQLSIRKSVCSLSPAATRGLILPSAEDTLQSALLIWMNVEGTLPSRVVDLHPANNLVLNYIPISPSSGCRVLLPCSEILELHNLYQLFRLDALLLSCLTHLLVLLGACLFS